MFACQSTFHSILGSKSHISLFFINSAYSGLISMPMALLPNCFATSMVVPLPAKGSRTTPSSGQPAFMQNSGSLGGNTAKWTLLLKGCVASSITSPGFLPSGVKRFSMERVAVCACTVVGHILLGFKLGQVRVIAFVIAGVWVQLLP